MGTIVTPIDNAIGNLTNYTVTWPDTNAGDQAIFVWSHSSTATITTDIDAVDAGFTRAGSPQTDGNEVLDVWTKTCSGSESGDITTSLSGGSRGGTHLVVIRGYGALEHVTQNSDAGTDANHTAPALTPPTTPDGGVVVIGGERVSSGSTSATPPSGYTIVSGGGTGGTGGNYSHVSYEGSGGTISGTHAVGVAINPGTWVHNVAASDVAMFTLYFPLSAVVVNPSVVGGSVSFGTTTRSAGASATPATISRTATVPAPTDVRAGAGISPATVSRTVAIGSPTVGTAAAATPATVNGTATLPAPTNVRAPVTLNPDTIVVKMTTGSGDEYWDVEREPYQIRVGYAPAPTGISRTVSIPSVTISIQNNTAAPATVSRTVAIPGNVAGAGTAVLPGGISRTVSFAANTVAAGAAPTPATVSRTVAIGAPTVNAGSGNLALPSTVAGTTTISGAASVNVSAAPATVSRTVVVGAPAISVSHTHASTTVAGTTTLAGVQAKSGVMPAPATISRTVAIGAHTFRAGASPLPVTVVGSATIGGTAGVPSPYQIDITINIGLTRMSTIGPTRRDRGV